MKPASNEPPIIDGPDGLQEYDNPMPRWMGLAFWGTILWGIGYVVFFPGVGLNLLSWSQYDRYQDELKLAAAQAPAEAPGGADPLVAALKDPQAAKAGEATFVSNCAACHGQGATGGIGPSLVDAAWLYGGEPPAIAHTLAEGTAKGMPPFKATLSPAQRAEVVAYLLKQGGR